MRSLLHLGAQIALLRLPKEKRSKREAQSYDLDEPEGMPCYKILSENQTHYGLNYKTGLNIDPVPFNPKGSCEPGGMYFAREHILGHLWKGPWIREVQLLSGTRGPHSRIYADPLSPGKWKTDMFVLGEAERITIKTLRRLIKEGAYVWTDDNYPLMWACREGNLKAVKLFIEKGASVRARDGYALGCALAHGHMKIVKYLLKNGGDTFIERKEAVGIASMNGYTAILRLLLKAGANPNYSSRYSPLSWAVRDERYDCVKALLKAGAVICDRTKEVMNKTGTDNRSKIVRLLYKTEAKRNRVKAWWNKIASPRKEK